MIELATFQHYPLTHSTLMNSPMAVVADIDIETDSMSIAVNVQIRETKIMMLRFVLKTNGRSSFLPRYSMKFQINEYVNS